MKRLILAYAIGCYVLFGIVFVWLAAFLQNFGGLRGPAEDSLAVSVAVNLATITLFGAGHSVMARPAFKRLWTRIVPPAAERATYVLQSSLLLALIFWQWRPIPTVIWQVDGVFAWIIYGVFALGAAFVLLSTILLGHFEFVGLSQAWQNLKGASQTPPAFRTPILYRIVRHPLQLGLIIMMAATPLMTAGHLLFLLAMVVYIAIGLQFEERALLREFGSTYAEYRRQVPMLIPNPFRQVYRRPAAD